MTSPNNESTSIQGLSFSDPRVAQRARDAIRQIASNTVDIKGSNPNVGRVLSVDIANLTASVWLPGDDGPIQVNLFPGSIPLDLGDYRTTAAYDTSTIGTGGLVYVENFRGRPYITRVLSGGEFALNASVAGLTHRMFNANYQGTVSGPPISLGDIYQREVNVLVNAGAGFVVGNSLLVGPWSGKNDGSSIDGIIELTLSFWVAGSVMVNVKKYQFSISDRMVVDLEGDEGNKPFWMRLLPETNLATNPHAQLEVDVALVKTGIRTNLEFWFRLVPLDNLADQSVYFLSVKSYGSAFNVGDPRTGRLVLIKETVAAPVQGWVGFNNAGMGWTERDEYPTFFLGSYYQGDEWSSGSWRSGPLRAANDLARTWRTTGQWSWFTDNKLFWEGNIVFSGIGPNYNGLHTGSVSVPFPSNSVPVFPSDPATFSTQLRSSSGGIQLNPGDTLYYGLMPGMGSGGQGDWVNGKDRLFFIVDNKTYNATQHNFSLPEWAIPIATRAYNSFGERSEITIHNAMTQRWLDDRTEYPGIISYTTSHSGIVGSDETETMDISSFRFRSKMAYRVTVKIGISSATVNQAVNVRLKKGATAAGTDLGEFLRFPIGNSTGVFGVHGTLIIYNDTGADVTTAITLTVQSTGANTTTFTRYASATSPSWILVEPIGNSGKYAALGRQV